MLAAARWICVTIVYTACALPVFVAFLQRPGNGDYVPGRRLIALVDGSGDRPYVYRTLLPTTVRVVRTLLPDAGASALKDLSAVPPVAELLDTTPAREQLDVVTYLIAYTLELASLIAFAFALRATIGWFYPEERLLADVLPALSVLALPVFFCYTSFDYDFPQLFLFTTTSLMLARRRWAWFYPLLALCGFSKETAFLLILMHVLGNAPAMPRRSLLAHAAAQGVILVAVRCLLQYVIFADNGGSPVELWLGRNWDLVTNPAKWERMYWWFTRVGQTRIWVPTSYNVLFLIAVPCVLWGWSYKPVFLRRSLAVVPILAVLMFFFGYFDEIRDYYEAYPSLVLLIAGSFARLRRLIGASTVEPSR